MTGEKQILLLAQKTRPTTIRARTPCTVSAPLPLCCSC